MAQTYGVTDFLLRGVSPGQDPRAAAANLERFAGEVIPRLRG